MDYDLIEAIESDNIERARELLDAGADPNSRDRYGEPALIGTSTYGHLEIAQILLEAGADLNIQNISGETALIEASMYEHIDIVRLLLEKGADVNIRDEDGQTALMQASVYGRPQIVIWLLDAGANTTILDEAGNTASYYALANGHDDIVELLRQDPDTLFDSPDGPDIEQMRHESARNIQRNIRGKQTRRKLTKQRQKHGRMDTPTTTREKMRRWTDLTKIYNEDDPIRGYEQFRFFPERLVPDVSRGTRIESDENERMADYLETMKKYGGRKKKKRKKKKKKSKKKKKKKKKSKKKKH